ncbi:SH2 domain-containing protein 4A isoform X2 [Takifugu rubripes]|uniref:SH2 domain-containing protein 4A-like n=1 Tax=Takifugu rubripes TaxID=31033 RepID=A0A3B5KHT7_TAKRU|nr:SH2 domain-containing protein 4A-like isoform X2 [Takifugu rubripes]|eukprot:XP_003970177.1 PREDICTED: SH2 domain-containing protein 4A-like isoform X2 [Takifugu rubripes]
MLAKILEDMWVDPEVLEALSEEQKRILFFKMREEQVRRWKEREEREERERRDDRDSRTKKGYSKHVTWLLGRDGDVRVSVIGELDEFRSSRILQSLMNNSVCDDNMNGIQTARLLAAREAQEDVQLSLTDVPEDPDEDSHSDSGSGLDNQEDWAPVYRPHLGSHGNQLPLKGQRLTDTEEVRLQDRESVGVQEDRSKHVGGLVALQKVFRDDLQSRRAVTVTHL